VLESPAGFEEGEVISIAKSLPPEEVLKLIVISISYDQLYLLLLAPHLELSDNLLP
jgi:hypothetical protein